MLCGLQGINAVFLNDNTFRKPFTVMSQVSLCTQILEPLDRTQVTVWCVLKQTRFSFLSFISFPSQNDKIYDNIITIRNWRDKIKSLLISKKSHSVAQF